MKQGWSVWNSRRPQRQGGADPAAGSSRGRTLALCSATHWLHDGLSDVNYVLLPILAQIFGLSLMQVGLLRSAWRSATSLFEIPAGLLAERFGAVRLLAFGTACSGIAFIAMGSVRGFTAILLTLFLAGFGSAFQHPLCSTLISVAYPEAGRRAALGTYNFAGDVGKFLLGGILSLLFVAGLSWRIPVLAFGALTLVCTVVLQAGLKEKGTMPPPAAPGREKPERRTDWGIQNRRGFLALCLIEVIDASTRTGFLTFVAFLIIEKRIPADWAAISVPLTMIGGMLGKLACGFLAERLGIVRTIAITEVWTGIGILLLLGAPGYSAFFLLPLVGIALNGTSSVLYATIGDLVAQDRLSRVFGLFYTISSVCSLAVPLLCGFLGDAIGISSTIALIGSCVFLTLPLCLMLSPALKPPGRRSVT